MRKASAKRVSSENELCYILIRYFTFFLAKVSRIASTFVQMNFRRWLQQLIKSAGVVDFYALDTVVLITKNCVKCLSS
jgi:hypothetical protein